MGHNPGWKKEDCIFRDEEKHAMREVQPYTPSLINLNPKPVTGRGKRERERKKEYREGI